MPTELICCGHSMAFLCLQRKRTMQQEVGPSCLIALSLPYLLKELTTRRKDIIAITQLLETLLAGGLESGNLILSCENIHMPVREKGTWQNSPCQLCSPRHQLRTIGSSPQLISKAWWHNIQILGDLTKLQTWCWTPQNRVYCISVNWMTFRKIKPCNQYLDPKI